MRKPTRSDHSSPRHSRGEVRFAIFGTSSRSRMLAVLFTERDGRIRIISAREATRRERAQYDEGLL